MRNFRGFSRIFMANVGLGPHRDPLRCASSTNSGPEGGTDGSSAISRRRLGYLLAAGVGLRDGAAQPPTLPVAAIQMIAELGNVESNLSKAEQLVRIALRRGARLVILPEFFVSGIAFHPEMAKATRAVDGAPAQMLRTLARQGNAMVGGSFLAWRDGNVYNSFVLALPDGSTRRHDKDHPTFWENCYYIGGHDDGVLHTPRGNFGAALCWEFVRSKTAERLKNRVSLVVGGSCWWTAKDSDPADHPYRRRGLEMLKEAPSLFARLVGVPVVHASHAGSFEGLSWPGEPVPYRSRYLGETQIVNGGGEVLARMSHEDGEGVITASVSPGPAPGDRLALPGRFWIPEFSDGLNSQWESTQRSGHEYYLSTTMPSLRRRFGHGAGKARRNEEQQR